VIIDAGRSTEAVIVESIAAVRAHSVPVEGSR
jgi:hypothetical protein